MSETPEVKACTEVRDGMRITWHQPIEMDDGLVLRAEVGAWVIAGGSVSFVGYPRSS